MSSHDASASGPYAADILANGTRTADKELRTANCKLRTDIFEIIKLKLPILELVLVSVPSKGCSIDEDVPLRR